MVERPELTAGELRVLNALAQHDTTAAIASTFHVSPNTVKSQLASVYRKLGCSKRDDAVRIAARLNLLAPPGDA
nr:helix-turn-helix transcriptional regulator [Microbacterium aquimaris]